MPLSATLGRWWGRLAASVARWRPESFSAGKRNHGSSSLAGMHAWGSREARMQRYDLLWSLYEATTYNPVLHPATKDYKSDHQIYEAVRPILNPQRRCTEFWAAHTYCGAIDPKAGDGRKTPSAIPIETDQDDLRPAIARLWRDSRWASFVDLWVRLGASMGDVGLKVLDDPDAGRVAMEIVDPRDVADYVEDPYGHCLAYRIEKAVPDPNRPADEQRFVIYREEAEFLRDAAGGIGRVEYRTFKDDVPYPWNGRAATWTERYGFIPFQMTTHLRVRADSPFGFAEVLSGLALEREANHIASMLSDFIGKSVDSPWLFAGVQKPKIKVVIPGLEDATNDPYDNPLNNPLKRRGHVPVLYAGPEAKAQALIAGLDLNGVAGFLGLLIEELKDEFPEIRRDIESAVGDATGAALRVARQRVETKAQKRRTGYDAALVRMHEAAIAIGGFRNYHGYDAFGLDLYLDNEPSHSIGHRSVFLTAPEDELERKKAFFANAESADRAGIPVVAYLEHEGWPEDEIAKVVAAQTVQLALGLGIGRQKQAPPANEVGAEAIQAPGGA